MLVSVSGSRNYNNYDKIKSTLDYYRANITHVNVGDARGVDSLVVRYCIENSISYTVFVADWNKYGKAAGPIRNQDIIKGTFLLIAFPTVDSKGTIHAINYANKIGINVHTYNV